MKHIPPLRTVSVLAALAALGPLASLQAATFSTDFNSGLPEGCALYGMAVVSPDDGTGGGYTNSGCLQLTTANPSQAGAFIITTDLDGGAPVAGFTAQFKAYVGGGNGADGFSFNFAPDLPIFTGDITEEGAGSGLTVEFDTFQNPGGTDSAPSIDVKVGGVEIRTNYYGGIRAGTFVDVVVQLNPDLTLDVIFDGTYICSKLDLTPYGYVPAAGSLFGWGARTGGSYDAHFIDDLKIVTQTSVGPYLASYSPRGRWVQQTKALDFTLRDYSSQVNTQTIVLQLDGAAVTPTLSQDGAGNTSVHYAPATPFAPLSLHQVFLTFADNSTPPQTSSFQYAFTALDNLNAGQYDVVFSDGFESYVASGAPLDMNVPGGANESPNGGPGNPWFGPNPPNSRVVGPEGTVVPHSGNNMIRGSAPNDLDENWYNLSYRLRGGGLLYGNCQFDWWFYDPLGPGGTGYRDFMALGYYNTAPTDMDYPGTGNLNGSSLIQRLCLGASSDRTGTYDNTVYQVRVVGARGGYATSSSVSGWFNTTSPRTQGWHHGRIIAGPPLDDNTANIYFYVDDMNYPVFAHNSTTTYGFNVLEVNVNYGPTTGYFDDVSFALAVPPKLVANASGSTLTLTWPGSGFTLQSATEPAGPYTDVPGALSGYLFDTSSAAAQFFRLRN